MKRPRLLDLFCGGGGSSVGYHRAGFDVTGCDIAPQKRYPFRLLVMGWREALERHGHEYDAFGASPECQGYCSLSHFVTRPHNMEIPEVREALRATGKPYVIENVPGALKHMVSPLMLCGSMFGLQTDCGAQLRRHRLFESNVLLMSPGHCRHGQVTIAVQGYEATNEAARRGSRRTIGVTGSGNAVSGGKTRVISVSGHTAENPATADHGRTISVVGQKAKDPAAERRKYRTVTVTGSTAQQNTVRNTERETFSVEEARVAMGIDWMVTSELSQAVPPSYTQFIGSQLLEAVR